jgi:hypothetical protein
MKYLKKFNENSDSFSTELESFCKEYLAYIIDRGFEVVVKGKYIIIASQKIEFNWIDIQDDFLSFYEMLKTKYSLVNMDRDSLNLTQRQSTEPSYSYVIFIKWNKEDFVSDFMLYNYDKVINFTNNNSVFYKGIREIRIQVKE